MPGNAATPWDVLLRGEEAVLEKRFADALPDLREALERGLDAHAYPSERGEYVPLPETALAEMLLGLAHFELGERSAALKHLNRAVDLDRDNARIFANRGHVHRECGELELAVRDLTQAIERWPDYGFALLRRAQCLATLERVAEAEADLARILKQNPHDEVALATMRALQPA